MTDVIELPAARPKRPKRRLRWRRLVVALLLVAAIGGLVWLVFFSSVLAASTVRVVGAQGRLADEVLYVAEVPLGTPLARLDAAAVGDRVATLPWVGSVEVRRGYPSEIVIAVTERTPVAREAGGPRAIAADGTVFVASTKLDPGLPSITASDDVARQAAAGVIASLPEDLRGRVVSARATTRDDVVLTLRSGAKVTWGSVDEAALKAQVLDALLARKARAYDVSAPGLPTTVDERAD